MIVIRLCGCHGCPCVIQSEPVLQVAEDHGINGSRSAVDRVFVLGDVDAMDD